MPRSVAAQRTGGEPARTSDRTVRFHGPCAVSDQVEPPSFVWKTFPLSVAAKSSPGSPGGAAIAEIARSVMPELTASHLASASRLRKIPSPVAAKTLGGATAIAETLRLLRPVFHADQETPPSVLWNTP